MELELRDAMFAFSYETSLLFVTFRFIGPSNLKIWRGTDASDLSHTN